MAEFTKLTVEDRLWGGFAGVALGDALGAPFEFNRAPLQSFTGYFCTHPPLRYRYGVCSPGRVTDDTEMTVTLASSIIDCQGFDLYYTIERYLDWCWFTKAGRAGKNTRALLYNVNRRKTFGEYSETHIALHSGDVETWSQGNGSLMRCLPLVIFKDTYNQMVETGITNVHLNNVWASYAYLAVARHILIHHEVPVTDTIPDLSARPELRSVHRAALHNLAFPLPLYKGQDGWVVYTYYRAMRAFFNFRHLSFSDFIYATISEGGDTDTYAAIAGGLYGLFHGRTGLLDDPVQMSNLWVILTNPQNKWLMKMLNGAPEKSFKRLSVGLANLFEY